MLRTLSEAVLYLSRQDLPSRGQDESSSSFSRGNYRKLLEGSAKFDTVIERRLHGKVAESEKVMLEFLLVFQVTRTRIWLNKWTLSLRIRLMNKCNSSLF